MSNNLLNDYEEREKLRKSLISSQILTGTLYKYIRARRCL